MNSSPDIDKKLFAAGQIVGCSGRCIVRARHGSFFPLLRGMACEVEGASVPRRCKTQYGRKKEPIMREVTVAATQFACSWDLPANADWAEALVRQAAGQGAQVDPDPRAVRNTLFLHHPAPRVFRSGLAGQGPSADRAVCRPGTRIGRGACRCHSLNAAGRHFSIRWR